jgi:putative sigma-54 modulation protein
MQVHITARHLKLTGAIYSHVAEKISHLEHLAGDIIGAHVVLWHDENKNPSRAFCVKAHLAVPGPDIHVEEYSNDLYAAIDALTLKVERQLRKRKTRRVVAKKSKMRKGAEKARALGI